MSIVVHGTWMPGTQTFFVWAETAAPRPHRGRRPAVPRHPFHEPPEFLLAALARTIALPHSVQSATATVWLPSSSDTPIPSPELIAMGAPVPPDGTRVLAPWHVAGVQLAVPEARTLLLSIGRTSKLRVGPDLQAWQTVLLLALSCLASQQVLPTLTREDQVLRAGWRLAPSPAMATTVMQVTQALPPLCRALGADPAMAPSARALVDDCMRAVITTTIRALPVPRTTVTSSPGASWIAALVSSDSRVRVPGPAVDALYRAWQAWIEQGSRAGTDAFRITFRLEAPPTDSEPWVLAYLIQATDDPSLLVPASMIWHEKGAVLTYLERRFHQPQEHLLIGLGVAARMFPPIAQSLRHATPDHAILSTSEALTFLKDVAPLLDQHGFAVLVPAWWTSRAAQVTPRVRAHASKTPPQTSTGVLSLESLLSFDWEFSLAGEHLSKREFDRLVRLKQPLVHVRGQWVVLDPESITHALACLTQSPGTLNVGDLVRLKLTGTHPEIPVQLDADAVVGDGWIGEMLATLEQQNPLAVLPPPAGLQAQLRPYQQRGYAWLKFLTQHSLGACLADDMGLGKTLQTIAFLLDANAQRGDASPALVVCPTSVVGNWLHELQTFAPGLHVLVHRGADRLHDLLFIQAARNADVVVTSYPVLTRDRRLFHEMTWSTVVVDEAQNIKNAETKQAQAVRSLKTVHRIALTGTPVENRLGELWSILSFLNPGYLGSQASFQRTFARPIERAGDAQATSQLRRLTAPLILRRLKTDRSIIADLPEKIETTVYCGLTKEQVTLYEAVVREALAELEAADEPGIRRRGLVLSMLVKLKQICNHPALFVQDESEVGQRSGKVARLTELLEEIAPGDDRVLIFTQFARFGGMLQTHLRELLDDDVLFLHGQTAAKERDQLVRRFQAPAGPKIFILSLKAGGTGLNLTAANHVFHIDRWWNPAVEQQATDRAFRIGQQRNVQVHTCICGGTLEDQIDRMIARKRALAESVLGSDERWLTELSTDQIRELVTLRSDMLDEV
jgi:SNF2 family DNA or RNA helicase